jgi:hypothetical protein
MIEQKSNRAIEQQCKKAKNTPPHPCPLPPRERGYYIVLKGKRAENQKWFNRDS